MVVYGYCRVSTDRQANEGESLAVQRRQIEGYCHMQGWDLGPVFVEEGVSGSTPLGERPQGRELLDRVKPGDVIVAAKLDRLFRSALDALQVTEGFRRRGVGLHLLDIGGDVSGNGLSKLFLTVAAAFAEAERDRIRERVQTTKDDMRAQGRYLGGRVPFGFKVEDGQLVEDRIQQAAIGEMEDLRGRGWSYRDIAREISGRYGTVISHEGVKRILNRDRAA